MRLLHAGAEVLARMLHCGRCDLVGEPHALELLVGLGRSRPREQGRRVGRPGEAFEPRGRERGRLADHAVGCLRAQRELEADAAVTARCLLGQLERAGGGRPRVVVGVPAEEANVVRPGIALCVFRGGLEADQRRLALTREDGGVVALHRPEVGQVEDVVGSAHDQGVEPLLFHERAHPFELQVVTGPAHDTVTLSAHPSRRHVRVSRVPSTSREAGAEEPHPGWGCGVWRASGPVTSGRARGPVRRGPPATRRPGCAARRSARSPPPSRRPA